MLSTLSEERCYISQIFSLNRKYIEEQRSYDGVVAYSAPFGMLKSIKTGARSARAAWHGQNPLVKHRTVWSVYRTYRVLPLYLRRSVYN
jgi:hypothetical protein